MGCDSDERTDNQMLFLYLLKLEINKEFSIIKKEKDEETKNTETFYFESEDEDEGPGED